MDGAVTDVDGPVGAVEAVEARGDARVGIRVVRGIAEREMDTAATMRLHTQREKRQ